MKIDKTCPVHVKFFTLPIETKNFVLFVLTKLVSSIKINLENARQEVDQDNAEDLDEENDEESQEECRTINTILNRRYSIAFYSFFLN